MAFCIETRGEAKRRLLASGVKPGRIWRSIRPDADELHTDPLIHSAAYEHLLSRLTKNAILTALLPIVILAVFVCGILLSPQPVTVFLASPSTLLSIPTDGILGVLAIQQALELRSLKRSLSNGFPAVHKKSYHRHLQPYRILRCSASLLMLVLLATPAAMFVLNWEKTVSDIDTKLPYLPLDVIEERQDFSWHKERDTTIRGADTYNRATYTWSPFVPAHYDIYQQGNVQNIYKNEDIIGIDSSAHTEYFRLALPAFTLPLYQERIRCYIHSDTNPVVTELSHPGFDHVTIAESDGYTQLFACRDKQVIHIQYWGDGDLAGKLDVLADAF